MKGIEVILGKLYLFIKTIKLFWNIIDKHYKQGWTKDWFLWDTSIYAFFTGDFASDFGLLRSSIQAVCSIIVNSKRVQLVNQKVMI